MIIGNNTQVNQKLVQTSVKKQERSESADSFQKGSPAEFSITGKTLVKSYFEQDATMTGLKEHRIARHDLCNTIEKDNMTSQDEKNIIKLGRAIAAQVNNNAPLHGAVTAALNAIANQEEGSTGQIMARVTQEAASKATTDSDKFVATLNGLSMIQINPKISEDEKTLTKLCFYQSFTSTALNNETLAFLSNPAPGPLATAIAGIVYNAANEDKDIKNKVAIQEQGFKAIMSHPHTSEEQKAIAKEAIEIANHIQDKNKLIEVRNDFLKKLLK